MGVSFRLIIGSFVTVFVGFLLNLSANVVDPSYAPKLVRWGWFFTASIFVGYVGKQAGIEKKISVSWIQTACRPLWVLGAMVTACVLLGAIYLSVNALWDKIGIRKESAKTTTLPSSTTIPDKGIASTSPTKPEPAPRKRTASTKTPDSHAPYDVEAEMRRTQILSTSFEDAWIEVRFAVTDAFMSRFHQLRDDKLLTPFKTSSYVNSIDKLSQEYYTAAWSATVGTVMPCSPLGILSSMEFPISLHPPLSVIVSNESINGSCIVMASLAGLSEKWLGLDRNGYILYGPVGRDYMSIRFRLSMPIMRYLSDNIVPTWNSFVIDKPTNVTLGTGPAICTWAGGESKIICAASNRDSILQKFIKDSTKAQDLFPPKITLLTELIGGPQVIREYTFVPGSAPSTYGIPFRWNLSRYDEVKGSFDGGDPPPPSSSQPRGERKPPAGRGSVAQR